MTRPESAPKAEWLHEVAWLLAQWHPSRNEPLDPKLLRAGSKRRVWWQCPEGHEWQTTIGGRARRTTRCPYCIGQRASTSNNLVVTAPDVAATWHPTRNETLTPAAVLPKSGRTVWWLCPAGHEWRTSVYARVSLRSGCPYCAGQRATDETSLAQRYPAVAGEWHPTRKGTAPRKPPRSAQGSESSGCVHPAGTSGEPPRTAVPCAAPAAGSAPGAPPASAMSHSPSRTPRSRHSGIRLATRKRRRIRSPTGPGGGCGGSARAAGTAGARP